MKLLFVMAGNIFIEQIPDHLLVLYMMLGRLLFKEFQTGAA